MTAARVSEWPRIVVLFCLATLEASATPNSAFSAAVAKNASSSVQSEWIYHQDFDRMRSVSSEYAQVASSDRLQLAPPYEGGSEIRLTLAKRPGRFVIAVSLSRGQFLCNESTGGVDARFDSRPIQHFGCTMSTNGISDVFDISDSKRFLEQLQNSRSLIIEVPIFREGRKQVSFNTAGLIWPCPAVIGAACTSLLDDPKISKPRDR